MASAAQDTPAVAYALGHRQDSAGKQRKEVLFKPLFQPRSPFASGKQSKPLWAATQPVTRTSGVGLVSSEGMLVSSRKPLTTGLPAARWKDCG